MVRNKLTKIFCCVNPNYSIKYGERVQTGEVNVN